jgi:hypothetical protein
MNSVPYLWVYILFATVTVPSLLLFGIAASLKSAGIPDKRIRRIVLSAGTLLFSWMALGMLLGWLGVFRSGGKVPFIAFGMCIPIVIGIWLIRRSATVREILGAVSQSSIVGVQGYRGLGAIFLVLYGQRLLPEVFALPAGFLALRRVAMLRIGSGGGHVEDHNSLFHAARSVTPGCDEPSCEP